MEERRLFEEYNSVVGVRSQMHIALTDSGPKHQVFIPTERTGPQQTNALTPTTTIKEDMPLLTTYHPINTLVIGIECLVLLLFLSTFYFICYRHRRQPTKTHTFELQSCPHSPTDILVPGDFTSPDSDPPRPAPAYLIGSRHNLQLDRPVRTTTNPWIGRRLNR